MNLSSRWRVTTLVAFGALSCSDPVPPPAQGAFIASVKSVSPAPAGKMCPSGTALTYDVPRIWESQPTEILTSDTYLHKATDRENSSTNVRCSVTSNLQFSGRIALGSRALEVSGGTLGADMKGTARITLTNSGSPGFSTPLSAPATNLCTIDAAAAPGNRLQVKAGSMWASFSCAAVVADPSDYCKAEGFFVLENCEK